MTRSCRLSSGLQCTWEGVGSSEQRPYKMHIERRLTAPRPQMLPGGFRISGISDCRAAAVLAACGRARVQLRQG
ncbi:hypothetical protein chiPu_0005934 [Chiloscyllium punctatum]|uniref:Uncharacterized protein n=1 Tax=Chiloscyllium punctatum TaxID=137246 RepID=A0A401SAW5_CHIPU|nr:hypothetical protein [Chiloscyllium punctatum]